MTSTSVFKLQREPSVPVPLRLFTLRYSIHAGIADKKLPQSFKALLFAVLFLLHPTGQLDFSSSEKK